MKKRKSVALNDLDQVVRIKYATKRIVYVGTYKTAIKMWLPDMENPLWLTAGDAEALAAALKKSAVHRRKLDVLGKRLERKFT